MGMPVTPIMDRNSAQVPTMQLGFIEFLVLPFLIPVSRYLNLVDST